jgi:hypothetical protein
MIMSADRRFDTFLVRQTGMTYRMYRDVPPYRVYVSDEKRKALTP